MSNAVRIGVEPQPAPPPRSSRLLVVAAVLVLLAAAGAWLAGTFGGDTTTTTTAVEITFATTTTAVTTTTLSPEDRLAAAAAFWTALGAGDAAAAAAAFPAAAPAAVDLMGFAAAFAPGFTVDDCVPFADNAVQCSVAVTAADLLAIGLGTPEQPLLVADDGWFSMPTVLASATARLSLYALEAHTDEQRAACPVTGNSQAPGLAIAGSATADCGAYLAGLIPEYLAAEGLGGGARD